MIQTLANQLNEEQQSQILDALSAGLNISAIKLYREATGCDLKTAKDFIDGLIAELNHDGSATPRNPARPRSVEFLGRVWLYRGRGRHIGHNRLYLEISPFIKD